MKGPHVKPTHHVVNVNGFLVRLERYTQSNVAWGVAAWSLSALLLGVLLWLMY